jgi:hypothetical protein
MQPEAAESFERECLRCKTVFAVRSVHSPDRFCQKCSETEQKRTDCPLCGQTRPVGPLYATGGLCGRCRIQRRPNGTRISPRAKAIKARRNREQRARNPDWEEQELDYRAMLARRSIEYYERAAHWSYGLTKGQEMPNVGEGDGPGLSESEDSQRWRAVLPVEPDRNDLVRMVNAKFGSDSATERQSSILPLSEDDRGAVPPKKPEWEEWTREHGPYSDGKLPWERRKRKQ